MDKTKSSKKKEEKHRNEIEELQKYIDAFKASETEHKQIEKGFKRKTLLLEQLLETAQYLTESLDIKEVLTRIGQKAKEILQANGCAIYLLESDERTLTPMVALEPPYDNEILSDPLDVDTSLTGQAVKARKGIIFNDVNSNSSGHQIKGTPVIKDEHVITAPFIFNDKVLGAMCLNRIGEIFKKEDLSLAETFATYATTALKNAQAHNKMKNALKAREKTEDELQRSEEKYHKLFNKIGDPIFIFDKDTHYFLDCNEAVLRTYGYSKDELVSMTPFDLHAPEDLERVKGGLDVGNEDILFTYTHVTKYGQRLAVEILSDEIDYEGKSAWISIVRDITERKQVEEQLRMSHDQLEKRVQQRAAQLEEINKQMKLEITERKRAEENLKKSFDTLHKTLEGIVHAMAIVVEARDPYTAGHQRRVAQLACAIAEEMGISEEQVEGIRTACLLHDIGKITIPIEILSKPGKLNEIEFTFIKKHPKVGYDILKGIEFPWKIAQIILQHHERLDGSGYPSGIGREEILLEARILGVADVVEAMSSHRPYRPSRGVDKALGEILENRGVLYEPEIVNKCLKIFAEKSFEFK